MKYLRIVMFFGAMIIGANISISAAADTCPGCTVTVTNSVSGTAHVTLTFSDGSSTTVGIGSGGSVPIPTNSVCPARLSGNLSYPGYYWSKPGISQRCLYDNIEGDALSCQADCRSSNWKIEGAGGAFHFNKMP